MSADTINNGQGDTLERNVWTIHGANWQANVPMDEYNSQFDPETQAMEAATQALAALKGLRSDITIQVDENEKEAFLGTTMIAHIKDTDPTKGFIPFTHVVLANDGFYKESRKMQRLFAQQLKVLEDAQKKLETEQLKREAPVSKLEKEIRAFEKLQAEINKGAKKKTRKKSK